jgi:hypothetical protein
LRKSLEDVKHMVKEKRYPGIMPDELLNYHYYISDAGHSIMCIPECLLEEAKKGDMNLYEVPIPVKYVLERGYRKEGDFIIIDAEYRLPYGLIVDDKYYEY